MALYYPLASAANKAAKPRSFLSLDSTALFRLGRFLGIIALGVIVLRHPELAKNASSATRHEDVGWLLILGLAPVSWLVDYWTPRDHRLVAQTTLDLSALLLCCGLLPQLWVPTLVLGALIIGGSVPRFAITHKFAFLLVPILFVSGMAALSSHFQIADTWWPLIALSFGTPLCLLYASREQHREKALRDRSNLMESLTHMAGGIGHDFNNLLTGIQGNAELAEQKLDPNHVARPYLQSLLNESQKAQLFSAQLLAFSGGVPTGRERLDVRAELIGLTGLLESALPRGVGLRLHADDNLPLVSANRAQLQEIVVAGILHVADAVKMGPAEVTVTLRRVTRRYSDELVIQLRANTVFGQHANATNYTVDRQNLASLRFGLSSAQTIMGDHDGSIDVHGNRREGRVITLRLPGLIDTRASAVRPSAPGRIVPRHVLLLESSPEVRDVVSGLLSELGHRVTHAERDADVVNAIIQDSSIDAVMLDTPGPISRILLSRIDSIRPGLPALLSEAARDRVGEWVERPNVNYVAKPYSSAILNSAIVRLFDPQRS